MQENRLLEERILNGKISQSSSGQRWELQEEHPQATSEVTTEEEAVALISNQLISMMTELHASIAGENSMKQLHKDTSLIVKRNLRTLWCVWGQLEEDDDLIIPINIVNATNSIIA